jgi:hypothetical protein
MDWALTLWLLATISGTILSILATIELRQNWRALNRYKRRPYIRVLRSIVLGNLFQQISRSAMELVCWVAVLVAIFGDPGSRGLIIAWLLVFYRGMHTANSLAEYISNKRRRRTLGS